MRRCSSWVGFKKKLKRKQPAVRSDVVAGVRETDEAGVACRMEEGLMGLEDICIKP